MPRSDDDDESLWTSYSQHTGRLRPDLENQAQRQEKLTAVEQSSRHMSQTRNSGANPAGSFGAGPCGSPKCCTAVDAGKDPKSSLCSCERIFGHDFDSERNWGQSHAESKCQVIMTVP
jgi:hypothetical protein